MIAAEIFPLLSRIGSAVLPAERAQTGSGQRGASTLALALIGLLVGTSLAAPAMQIVVGSFTTTAGASASVDARSAAEHALWRLENDPAVHDEMTGSPPSTDYVLGFPTGDANINIVASSDPPTNQGLRASINVSPTTIEPDTATEITFTLTLINDGDEAQDVTRFRAIPLFFSPSYISGSTTGATTQNPTVFFGIYTWELLTPVSVPGFGGTTSISWRMTFDLPEGQYWTAGIVRVNGEGNVYAPLDAYVRAVVINDIDVSTVVTPNKVTAGSAQTFTYTVTITNNGLTDYTIDWLKHYVPNYLDHVPGSTTGLTTADPARTLDFINSRWVYTWTPSSVIIPASGFVTLQFDITGSPLPGTIFASSAVRVVEDEEANWLEPTSSTGDTAPISVVRHYTITATQNGQTVTVQITLTNAGIEIISWVES